VSRVYSCFNFDCSQVLYGYNKYCDKCAQIFIQDDQWMKRDYHKKFLLITDLDEKRKELDKDRRNIP